MEMDTRKHVHRERNGWIKKENHNKLRVRENDGSGLGTELHIGGFMMPMDRRREAPGRCQLVATCRLR